MQKAIRLPTNCRRLNDHPYYNQSPLRNLINSTSKTKQKALWVIILLSSLISLTLNAIYKKYDDRPLESSYIRTLSNPLSKENFIAAHHYRYLKRLKQMNEFKINKNLHSNAINNNTDSNSTANTTTAASSPYIRISTNRNLSHSLKIPNQVKPQKETLKDTTATTTLKNSLSCKNYGQIPQDTVKDLIYWNKNNYNIQNIKNNTSSQQQYLTFELDTGGMNNIRLQLETIIIIAHVTNRILVLPPTRSIYLLNHVSDNQFFNIVDFFHDIPVPTMTMIEFLTTVVFSEQNLPQNLINKTNNSHHYSKEDQALLNNYLRNVTQVAHWNSDTCILSFSSQDIQLLNNNNNPNEPFIVYEDTPLEVNASPKDRFHEIQSSTRHEICQYNKTYQQSFVVHLPFMKQSRLLAPFYSFLFFQDWKRDLFYKRFVRDHIRYNDQIQCLAANVIQQLKLKSKDETYHAIHVRRGDFQYTSTRISVHEIFKDIQTVIPLNSTLFIATDESNHEFFHLLKQQYQVSFLQDFISDHKIKHYYGMIDQIVCSRANIFFGTYYSTFSSYIMRLRGYHSQKDRIEGYENGTLLNSFYFQQEYREVMHTYTSVHSPLWAREFPLAWRDLDFHLNTQYEDTALTQ